MNAPSKVKADTNPLTLLREPFAAHQISKLPKETRAQIDERKSNRDAMVFNCKVCGGHHHKNAVHLDYVGHAALTDRLLDTDIEWSWEPVAFTQEGLPAFDRNGGLWIKLTVGGVTRLGYGAADGKTGGDAVKEIIGDALRNAAMRFGAALDLWHKGDLHAEEQPEEKPKRGLDGPYTSKDALKNAFKAMRSEVNRCGDDDTLECLLATDEAKKLIAQCDRDAPHLLHGNDPNAPEWIGLYAEIQRLRDKFQLENIG